jgi:sortase A
MKRLLPLLLAMTLTATLTIPALATDYTFGSGGDALGGFGKSTSVDVTVTPEPLSENVRRNKDAALLPPPYFYGSGDIPTDPASQHFNNLLNSGFVPANQNLPSNGGENYAPGSSIIATNTPELMLPSTSQTASLNTTPWYYADNSIGSLYVSRTGKTVKVYEGEDLANLKIGAGHFSSTSAWDGNVALAGHNRGGSAYFSFVKDMQIGDRVTYTTRYGVRTYEVYSKTQIGEYDNLPLSWSSENIITLITCVADVPELRYSVQAREVR